MAAMIPPGPTPPDSQDPATFDERADASLAWQVYDLAPGANAIAVAVEAQAIQVAADRADIDNAMASILSAANTTGSSTTTIDIGTGGDKVYSIAGKSYLRNMFVVTAYDADNYMISQVRSYADPLLTVRPVVKVGSGSRSSWSIFVTGPPAGMGRHAIPIPARSLLSRLTNGAAPGLLETSTNKIAIPTLDFDPSTIEYAQIQIAMPVSWDEGTVSFIPYWSHPATTTNFKVSWGMRAVAVSNGDALDAAMGTGQFSNDTGGTTDLLYVGPESSAITVGGTPQAGDFVTFEIYRKADDGTNDTLAVDARLHGLVLIIQTNDGAD